MRYFDYNATTPLLPQALDKWLTAQKSDWYNPASPYQNGQKVRAKLEDCREKIAALWGVSPQEIVFTSGATEAANHVIKYLSQYTNGIIWRSGQEHSCITEPVKRYFADRSSMLDIENTNILSPDNYQKLIGKKDIVVLQAANHETGVIHDWSSWAGFCADKRIPFICDQTQILGKIPLQTLAKTTWAFASGHKFGAPKGVGVLRVPTEYSGFKGQVGGQQQEGYRAGTEDYPGAIALVTALTKCEENFKDLESIVKRTHWREQFIQKIFTAIPTAQVAAQNTVNRLWNTVLLQLPKKDQLTWVQKLDRAGFFVSTGSACSTNSDLSPTLLTLGYSPDEIKTFIRISSGWQTTAADWDALAEAIIILWSTIDDDSSTSGITEVIKV